MRHHIWIVGINLFTAIIVWWQYTNMRDPFLDWSHGFLHKSHRLQNKRRGANEELALSKNFYRLYKYMYIQTVGGARAEDIIGSLHRVVEDPHLKDAFMRIAAISSQSNDLSMAIQYMKTCFPHEDGRLLVSILESVVSTGVSKEAFFRMDHMMFQKYLSQLRWETQRIRRRYFYAVVCFVAAVSGLLLFPILDQMFASADLIFR